MAERRFSHAIAEGDGISVIAAVDDADAARAAESQRAEALVVRGDPAAIRDATTLPILWRLDGGFDAAPAADAIMLPFDEDDDTFADKHRRAVELGLDCAVAVRDEESLELVLDQVDPEIFLLAPEESEDGDTPLETVLDLLANVPAGKLAIADLPLTTPREVQELERAGCDAVIVRTANLAPLVGESPPEV
jgi:hypothetical protein